MVVLVAAPLRLNDVAEQLDRMSWNECTAGVGRHQVGTPIIYKKSLNIEEQDISSLMGDLFMLKLVVVGEEKQWKKGGESEGLPFSLVGEGSSLFSSPPQREAENVPLVILGPYFSQEGICQIVSTC